MEYASNAKGNLGVTLGAVGTGLGLLDGGANILGKMLGASGGSSSPEDKAISRYEMDLIKESMNQKIENGYLRSQLDTDAKLDGIKKQLADQMAFNATIGAQTSAVAAQTTEIKHSFERLTRNFVPNENIAPGWGFANVQPAPPLPPYPYPYYGPFPFFPPAPPAPPTQTTTQSTTQTGTNG